MRNSPRRTARLLGVLLPALTLAVGCGGDRVAFRYPGEQIDFSLQTTATPRLFIDTVNDLRGEDQRRGGGHFFGVDYPGDDEWGAPVVQIYRDALVQDLTQTNLIELVPLMRQADYVMSVEILEFGGRVDRGPMNFLLPLVAGLGAGLVVGDDTSSGLKIGAVLGFGAVAAVPTPTKHRAACEVRMILRNAAGETIWSRACLGEVSDGIWITATSRDVQDLVDKYLTVAVKRCNACLLGQLRQALLTDAG
ncbi:MAG: hypothetical protein R6X25_02260 [Candidatus Krumholzibacteriia bacterium]